MADMIADGVNWLHGVRHTNSTRTVTYTRGAHSATVLATVGRHNRTEGDSADPLIARDEERDWLVRADDLVLNAARVTPQAGDTITETYTLGGNSTTAVWAVNAQGGEPCWRWSDTNHKVMRIHTTRKTASS